MNDTTKSGKKSQIDRFKEAAEKLGADESEAAFDEKLKEIARAKPIAKPIEKTK